MQYYLFNSKTRRNGNNEFVKYGEIFIRLKTVFYNLQLKNLAIRSIQLDKFTNNTKIKITLALLNKIFFLSN